MTIAELIKLGINKLSDSTSPALDAEVLLSHLLDKPKEFLITNFDKEISRRNEIKYKKLLARRRSGWPVAYLTNKKEFLNTNFYVNQNVLVPRPETEGLVEVAVDLIKEHNLHKILDVGTGSGNIIISIAKLLTRNNNADYEYFATDVSPKAIAVAKKNARINKVKISFIASNLLQRLDKLHFDIILANLPYGWKEWKNNSSADTKGLKFEPAKALFTDKKGLGHYSKLFSQVSKLKDQPRILVLEFDPRQTTDLKKLVTKSLKNYHLTILKDLSGRDRYCQLIKKTRS